MQIRINSTQSRTNTTQPMNAATVCLEAQSLLHQLSMPIDPRDTIKARRERAIRRAGISPAKGFRLWYGYATALMAHEYLMICEAAKHHVRAQETQLESELEQLRALRALHEQRTRQHDLLAATVSQNAVEAVGG